MSEDTAGGGWGALARERERDRYRDQCGVFGVYGHPDAAHLTYLGLYALQHRGQENCGIATARGAEHSAHRAMGLVADNFSDKILHNLAGRHAIGHVRYSTAGGSHLRNAQPFCASTDQGPVALAHNGNLINAGAIRQELEGRGAILTSSSDSEVIVHLLARSREATPEERLIDALSRTKGAYSLLMLTSGSLVAARDSYGFRPLVLGRLGKAWVFASETCALDLIGADYERDIAPGEVVVIRRGRARSHWPFPRAPRGALCVFEYIYFARPDSDLAGTNVYRFRKELGRALAREHPATADMVVPVLDSGNAAALGYAEEVGIPYEAALIRNQYVKRTFIEPSQSVRDFRVKVKHNASRGLFADKRVVLVEDSIVRGTTLLKIVALIRSAGAREVHVRVSSPPNIGPCYYGIDTPTRGELIAHRHTVEEIRDILGCDSLGYLSLAGLHRSAEKLERGICDACFSASYPIPVASDRVASQLALFHPATEEAEDPREEV